MSWSCSSSSGTSSSTSPGDSSMRGPPAGRASAQHRMPGTDARSDISSDTCNVVPSSSSLGRNTDAAHSASARLGTCSA
eukprot:352088-Chlamydomonas_euryale.AAC.10